MGDDVRERRLAEPGRAEDEQVIQRLAAGGGRLDEDVHLAVHGGLADVVHQPLRANAVVQAVFPVAGKGRYQTL